MSEASRIAPSQVDQGDQGDQLIEFDLGDKPALEMLTVGKLPSKPLVETLGHAKGRLSYEQSQVATRRCIEGKYSAFNNFISLVDSQPSGAMIIVGGGASLTDTLLDIKIKTRVSKRWQVMACNRSHDYLVKNGLGSKVAYATMCDPADWIADYITPRKGVKYLLASQLHQKTLDRFLPFKTQTYIWYCDGIYPEGSIRAWVEKEWPGRQFGFFGRHASCIGMLALFEATVMGCTEVDLHGFDSCYLPDRTDFHAYPKPRTTKRLVDITVKSKLKGHTLRICTNPEMARQALEFGNLIESVNNYDNDWHTKVTVFGDGVIPWLAWKDGGRYFKHADPAAMERKYGNAEMVDIRPAWAVDESGKTKVFAP